MPRYHLHLSNGTGFTEDQEGAEYFDLADAREKAIVGLRDIMAGELVRGELNLASFIEIEDSCGKLILVVPFDEAVTIASHVSRPRRCSY